MPTEPGHVGLLADLPAPTAALKERLYVASDGGATLTGGLYQCNGTAWRLLFSLPVPQLVSGDVRDLTGAGAPVDGVAGTGAASAGPGSRYTDITNANLYINANTKASPTWKLVTRVA